MTRTFLICVLSCLTSAPPGVAAPTYETVAGTGASDNNGDAGTAATINIGEPFGVTIGPDGAVYITEVRHHRVRRLDAKTKELATVAGSGQRGYSGDGGPARKATLNEPYEVRFDTGGNMYIVEMKNHIVRRVDRRSGTITTVAGTGQQGFSGDGGPATKAMLSQPHSIAIESTGAIYIADIGNHRIRRVDPKSGIIESIAGNGDRKPPRDGQVARDHTLVGPRALDIAGNTLWIALREGHSVWRMDLADGILHHVAGAGQAGYSGDGGPALAAKFNGPKGIAVARDGKIAVCDSGNNVIRLIYPKSGTVSTVAIGKSQDDKLSQPHGVSIAPDGDIFIGDTMNHRVLRVKQ